MGTRARTVFVADTGTLCRLYQSKDGDPQWHGMNLALALQWSDKLARPFDFARLVPMVLDALDFHGPRLITPHEAETWEVDWVYHVEARPTSAEATQVRVTVYHQATNDYEFFPSVERFREWCAAWKPGVEA